MMVGLRRRWTCRMFLLRFTLQLFFFVRPTLPQAAAMTMTEGEVCTLELDWDWPDGSFVLRGGIEGHWSEGTDVQVRHCPSLLSTKSASRERERGPSPLFVGILIKGLSPSPSLEPPMERTACPPPSSHGPHVRSAVIAPTILFDQQRLFPSSPLFHLPGLGQHA